MSKRHKSLLRRRDTDFVWQAHKEAGGDTLTVETQIMIVKAGNETWIITLCKRWRGQQCVKVEPSLRLSGQLSGASKTTNIDSKYPPGPECNKDATICMTCAIKGKEENISRPWTTDSIEGSREAGFPPLRGAHHQPNGCDRLSLSVRAGCCGSGRKSTSSRADTGREETEYRRKDEGG